MLHLSSSCNVASQLIMLCCISAHHVMLHLSSSCYVASQLIMLRCIPACMGTSGRFCLYKIWNLMLSIKKKIHYFCEDGIEKFFPQHCHSSHYAVTHVHNKNSYIQGRSSYVVKVVFHTIRNCS